MEVKLVDQNFEVLTPEYVYRSFICRVEEYGRVCYKSKGVITRDTAESFTKRIMASGHESVLEHCNLTIKFTVDRAIANALVRHRHCAFTQESTHFIDYLKGGEIRIVKQENLPEGRQRDAASRMIGIYSGEKEARSSARRALLPLCLKTELVMTTNIREWRHILKIRTQPECHPQMRGLMSGVLKWFRKELPTFAMDI